MLEGMAPMDRWTKSAAGGWQPNGSLSAYQGLALGVPGRRSSGLTDRPLSIAARSSPGDTAGVRPARPSPTTVVLSTWPRGRWAPRGPNVACLSESDRDLDPAMVARPPIVHPVQRGRRDVIGDGPRSEDEVELTSCRRWGLAVGVVSGHMTLSGGNSGGHGWAWRPCRAGGPTHTRPIASARSKNVV